MITKSEFFSLPDSETGFYSFKKCVDFLEHNGVTFIVTGSYALLFHGLPIMYFPKDIDILVEDTTENRALFANVGKLAKQDNKSYPDADMITFDSAGISINVFFIKIEKFAMLFANSCYFTDVYCNHVIHIADISHILNAKFGYRRIKDYEYYTFLNTFLNSLVSGIKKPVN